MHIFGWPTPPPPRIWIWIRIRIKILSWIRIRIETLRIHSSVADPRSGSATLIHSPGLNYQKIVVLFIIMFRYGKQTCIFFLLPTASSFLITSLSGWGGGDAHGRGGGCTWGGGGMHVHPVHPPWVRPWVPVPLFIPDYRSFGSRSRCWYGTLISKKPSIKTTFKNFVSQFLINKIWDDCTYFCKGGILSSDLRSGIRPNLFGKCRPRIRM